MGAAAGVSQLAEAGAFSALTVIAGRLGGEAVAAYQLLLNTLAVVFMISLGVAAATAVLSARPGAARRARIRAHRLGRAGAEQAAMLVCALCCSRSPSPIADSLTSDAALRRWSRR